MGDPNRRDGRRARAGQTSRRPPRPPSVRHGGARGSAPAGSAPAADAPAAGGSGQTGRDSREEGRSRPLSAGPPGRPWGWRWAWAAPSTEGRSLIDFLKAALPTVQRATFPLLLLLIVALFFWIQNLIDRKDPKLALAPINDEPYVGFGVLD